MRSQKSIILFGVVAPTLGVVTFVMVAYPPFAVWLGTPLRQLVEALLK